MIVRLTHGQWGSMRGRIPPHVAEWMAGHRAARGKQHDYVMPAIGWKQAHDALVASAYGPLGGSVDSTPTSLYRAIARISKLLGAAEAHPAMKVEAGIMGVSTAVIPAFEAEHVDGTERTAFGRYTPYPTEGRFVILRPQLIVYSGHDLTVWRPGSADPEDVTHEVAHHRYFVDR